jgi:hypothetical protein
MLACHTLRVPYDDKVRHDTTITNTLTLTDLLAIMLLTKLVGHCIMCDMPRAAQRIVTSNKHVGLKHLYTLLLPDLHVHAS